MTDLEDGIARQLEVCSRNAAIAGPWVVLGRLYLAANRAAEAVAAADKALALDPKRPAARSLRKAAVEALESIDPDVAVVELNAALHSDDPNAHLDLGLTYAQLDRPADAERCFKRALEIVPDMAAAQASLGAVYLSVGIKEGAEHYSRMALETAPGQPVASQTLAAILEGRDEYEAAQALLEDAYMRQSVFIEPARGSPFTVLVLVTKTSGNIPYRYIMPSNRYTRIVWYLEYAREGDVGRLPPYDVVFNAIGDPDLAAPALESVRGLLANCPRPALNHPAQVERTHRHLTPTLLQGLDDVVVPATVRLGRHSIQRLGLANAIGKAGLSTPALVRPAGSHGGKGLLLAQTQQELTALEAEFLEQDVYATCYFDYRSLDGFFRKGRIVFVDRKPYPYHWAISEHWLVHYESAGMRGDQRRQDEERRFLDRPESVIGEKAVAAIASIGQRLDLDYCGLDFSVLPDGRVLVFEANATMLAHSEDEHGEFAYKNPAVQRIIDAFQTRLAELAAKPQPAAN